MYSRQTQQFYHQNQIFVFSGHIGPGLCVDIIPPTNISPCSNGRSIRRAIKSVEHNQQWQQRHSRAQQWPQTAKTLLFWQLLSPSQEKKQLHRSWALEKLSTEWQNSSRLMQSEEYQHKWAIQYNKSKWTEMAVKAKLNYQICWYFCFLRGPSRVTIVPELHLKQWQQIKH